MTYEPLPYRDMDPPDDPTHWLITYRIEGEVVERERFKGDYLDAERQAEDACEQHWDNTCESTGDGLHQVGEKLDYTIEPIDKIDLKEMEADREI